MPTTIENADLLDAMADQIRDALQSALASSNITVQVHPRMLSACTPPTVDMYPGDLSRGTDARAFGIRGEHLFTVRCRVDENDAEANQDLLLNFMDDINPLSVAGALLDEPTLGGVASDVSVDESSVTGFALYGDLVGFQFTAAVIRADS